MAFSSGTLGSARRRAIRLRAPVFVLLLAIVALSPVLHTHGLFSAGFDPSQRGGEKQSCPACVFNTNAGLVPDTTELCLTLEVVASVEIHSTSCLTSTFSAETGRSPPAA